MARAPQAVEEKGALSPQPYLGAEQTRNHRHHAPLLAKDSSRSAGLRSAAPRSVEKPQEKEQQAPELPMSWALQEVEEKGVLSPQPYVGSGKTRNRRCQAPLLAKDSSRSAAPRSADPQTMEKPQEKEQQTLALPTAWALQEVEEKEVLSPQPYVGSGKTRNHRCRAPLLAKDSSRSAAPRSADPQTIEKPQEKEQQTPALPMSWALREVEEKEVLSPQPYVGSGKTQNHRCRAPLLAKDSSRSAAPRSADPQTIEKPQEKEQQTPALPMSWALREVEEKEVLSPQPQGLVGAASARQPGPSPKLPD